MGSGTQPGFVAVNGSRGSRSAGPWSLTPPKEERKEGGTKREGRTAGETKGEREKREDGGRTVGGREGGKQGGRRPEGGRKGDGHTEKGWADGWREEAGTLVGRQGVRQVGQDRMRRPGGRRKGLTQPRAAERIDVRPWRMAVA